MKKRKREASGMAEELTEPLETPFPCEDTTEYDNRIEDEVEIEPEEEQEDFYSVDRPEEVEQQFARYERSYRARRIREMTRVPIRKRRSRHGRMLA
jgi:hypothetical protein